MVFFMAAMPEMGMPAMRVERSLQAAGAGRYRGALELPSGGRWTATVVARRAGQVLASRQFILQATGGM